VTMWLGLVLGLAGIAMAAVADHRAETIVKLIASAIWLAVSAVAWTSHRALAQMPDTEPAPSSSAA
jgi:drug/metabolite transporter (DMT)-like permease